MADRSYLAGMIPPPTAGATVGSATDPRLDFGLLGGGYEDRLAFKRDIAGRIDDLLGQALGPTGIPDRLTSASRMFNPISQGAEAGGATITAFDDTQSPEVRRQAAIDAVTGTLGAAAPAIAGKFINRGTANALWDTLVGIGNPLDTVTGQALADTARGTASDLRYAGRSALQGDLAGVAEAFTPSRAPRGIGADVPEVAIHRSAQNFGDIDLSKSADGTFWMASPQANWDNIVTTGKGFEHQFEISPSAKLATWDDIDRYSVGELQNMGYDGVRMDDGAGDVTYQIWNTDALKRLEPSAPQGILAYHGSPHTFDRFSLDAIGTGEGAQVYGHGLYFAEAEPVAKAYRDQLSKGNTSAARRALEAAGGDVDRAIQDVESKLSRLDERAALGDFGGDERRFAAQRQIQSDKIQQLRGFKETGEFDAGRMYEVNIKANPEDFLDWDKPLSEQPNILSRLGLSGRTEDEINTEATRLMEEGNAKAGRAGGWMGDPEISARINALNDEINNLAPSVSGESFYRSGGQGGVADLMSQLGSGSPQMRSQELLKAGIPGIKYLDAMSRGAGEGSRNYVVFDEKLIDIVKRYGIAGAATMLGMSQLDLENAMRGQQQPVGLLGSQM